MGETQISAAIVILLVCIVSNGPQNVNGATCSSDLDCKPQVICQVTTWECNGSDTTLTTPFPGQSKPCCEYLDTCGKDEPVSGWVWTRETTREHRGKNHHSDWTDMYVSDANDSYISSHYAGSWNTFNENCTTCDLEEAQIPTEIYVLEPINTCGGAERLWPEWYQIALASKDPELNISGLTIDDPEDRSCLCDLSYTCENNMCAYQTDFDVGEQPNSTLPETAKDQQCFSIQGIERGLGKINSSSIFASGYDVETARFNVWIETDSVEGGWAPNLNDEQKWIQVTFDNDRWISGIITQGMALNIERRVDSFIVEYQNASNEWYVVGNDNRVFYAGARYDTEVINYFPEPVRATALLIHIMTPCDPGYVGMRFELLGCPVCYNNSMCATGGLCLDTGACSYDGLILDDRNYEAGLNVLEASNSTDAEKVAYDTIVGYLGPLKNLTTIVFENVTLNVARAAIVALTNITAEGNKSKSETGALAIQKIEVLVVVLANENTAAFAKLDTPEALEEAKTVVDAVVNLVDTLFSDDNAGGWDLLADIALGIYDPNTAVAGGGNTDGGSGGNGADGDGGGGDGADGGGGDGDGTGGGDTGGTGGDGTGGGSSGSGSTVQVTTYTEEEQKELAKAESATTMVNSVTAMVIIVASQTPLEHGTGAGGGGAIFIQKANIEVYAERSQPDTLEDEGFEYPNPKQGHISPLGAKVTVDAKEFNFDGDNGTAHVVSAVVIIDTAALRTNQEAIRQNDPSQGLSQAFGRLVSDFISISFIVNGSPLSIPVSYSMLIDGAIVDKHGKPLEKPQCVFDDEKEDFGYSGEGLTVDNHVKGGGKTKDKIDCKSNHLTTFAVLMYLSDVGGISQHHLDIQDTITKVCSGLSILALAAAIGVLIYLRSTLMSERIIIHLTLMITTLLATLGFMFGIDRTKPTVLCKVITILLHFLYTAIFSWMLVEGVHLYRQIITVFESEKSRLSIYFVLGWGVPTVIVVVAAAVEWDKYGGEYCFLKYDDNTLWAFVGPIIPVILINFIVLLRVAKIVVMAAKLNDTGDGASDTVNRVKAGLRSSIMLLPILGLTWVIGYMQHLSIVLMYVFVILNSLQGFFMALFHCAMSSEVRGAIQQRIKKLKDSSLGPSSSGNQNQTLMSQNGSSFTKNNKVVPECAIQDVD